MEIALKGSWEVQSGLIFKVRYSKAHNVCNCYELKEVLLRVSQNPISPMLHFLQFCTRFTSAHERKKRITFWDFLESSCACAKDFFITTWTEMSLGGRITEVRLFWSHFICDKTSGHTEYQ